jgi:uncharacterized protein HemX
MIRKIVIVAVAVALLGVAGGLAIQKHRQVVKTQAVAAQRAAEQAKAKADEEKANHDALVSQFKKVQSECDRASQAWANVPAAIRARVPAPDCSVTVPIQ